jgi:hypothetical protein
MNFPPKWHVARGNTYVFGTLLFLWPFNDPGWRPRRLTPQGLKDIFCRLKLFAGKATAPPTKSIGRIATKDTLPAATAAMIHKRKVFVPLLQRQPSQTRQLFSIGDR